MSNVKMIDTRRTISEQLQAEAPEAGQERDPRLDRNAVAQDHDDERELRRRLDDEARLANAMARVKYSEEAKAAIDGAVAPEINELALDDLRRRVAQLIHELCQALEDNGLDFHRQQFAGDMCWKFNQYLAQTRENMERADLEITRLYNTGSEIDERRAIRKLRFKDQLVHQESILLAAFEAAEEVHFDVTGRAWVQPTRRDVPGVNVDRARVKMIAEQVQKRQSAKAGNAAQPGTPPTSSAA